MRKVKVYSEEGKKIYDYIDAFVLAQQLTDHNIEMVCQNSKNSSYSSNFFTIEIRRTKGDIKSFTNSNLKTFFNINTVFQILENKSLIEKAKMSFTLEEIDKLDFISFLKRNNMIIYMVLGTQCHIEFSTVEQVQALLMQFIESKFK